MQEITDHNGVYRLPEMWDEVTVAQFCKLAKLSNPTIAAAAYLFAGRPVEITSRVAVMLAFLNLDPPPTGGRPYPTDLGQQTYLQVELIRQALYSGGMGDWLPRVYSLFTARTTQLASTTFSEQWANTQAEACLTWPLTDVFPAVVYCLAEFERLNEQYAELGQPCLCRRCTTGKVVAAQVHLNFLDTLDALAKQLGVPATDIGQMPFETVADFLLQAKREHATQALSDQN